jgi:hypothetical protein
MCDYPALLHHELNCLPEKLRDPLILCHLEGQTDRQAARLLGCPLRALRVRLNKGREALRARLDRHGLSASLVLLVLATLEETPTPHLPDKLVDTTVEAAKDVLQGTFATVNARIRLLSLTETVASAAPRLSAAAAAPLLLLSFALGALGTYAYTLLARHCQTPTRILKPKTLARPPHMSGCTHGPAPLGPAAAP